MVTNEEERVFYRIRKCVVADSNIASIPFLIWQNVKKATPKKRGILPARKGIKGFGEIKQLSKPGSKEFNFLSYFCMSEFPKKY